MLMKKGAHAIATKERRVKKASEEETMTAWR